MAFNFVFSQGYNGHDLTLALLTRTGTTPTYDASGQQTGEEDTHTLRAATDSLTELSFPAPESGSTISNPGCADKLIAALDIDGGDKIYSHDENGQQRFRHIYGEEEIDLLDGTTAVSGVTVRIYYLDDADGETQPGIRYSDLAGLLIKTKAELKASLEEIPDQRLYDTMTGLGFAQT